jgi:hypothetical protein
MDGPALDLQAKLEAKRRKANPGPSSVVKNEARKGTRKKSRAVPGFFYPSIVWFT